MKTTVGLFKATQFITQHIQSVRRQRFDACLRFLHEA